MKRWNNLWILFNTILQLNKENEICVEFSKRMGNQVNIDESIAGVVKKFENY